MFHFETLVGSSIRLAVIADDITGAFDTGVQFSKRGSRVSVATGAQICEPISGADVLVLDAQTRHLTPREAYVETRRIVAYTMRCQIPYLYIKTDSGLRGNIGPALKATLDETGESFAAFSPAYPDTNRVTRGGKQWIDGQPIQDSVFGRDLFEPVRASRVSDLLRPFGLDVCECHPPYQLPDRRPIVALFDVERNEDFRDVADLLKANGRLRITSGCAAFAAVLPAFLGLPDLPCVAPIVRAPLMIVCGSLNPITRRQFEYGERIGYKRIVLSQRQLLDEGYFDSEEGLVWLKEIGLQMLRRGTLMFDTGLCPSPSLDYADLCAARKRIAKQLGLLLVRLLAQEGAEAYTPMIIGGDTLAGFLDQLGTTEVSLGGEVSTGVVMFSVSVNGRRVSMLSKSGGFGNETLLGDVITQGMLAR